MALFERSIQPFARRVVTYSIHAMMRQQALLFGHGQLEFMLLTVVGDPNASMCTTMNIHIRFSIPGT